MNASLASIQPSQLKRIHMLRRQGNLQDDDYRAILRRLTGKSSAKALSAIEADTVLRHLGAGTSSTSRAATADGPYAGILRALWFDAYQLGLVRSVSDRALIGWVQRQTRVSHTRFLTEPEGARPAIEGLKKWIAREAGVVWPAGKGDVGATKRAVVMAQFARLVDMGAWPPFGGNRRPDESDLQYYAYRRGLGPNAFTYYTEEHWDRLIKKLGIWLRGALKARAEGASK